MLPEDLKSSSGLKWQVFSEKPGIWGEADFVKNVLVDHINTTKDTTDYLWYTTRLVFTVNTTETPFEKEPEATIPNLLQYNNQC